MSNAIWMILYDLQREREAEYMDWFHDIHIPEKLARPGYTWAAHYAEEGDNGLSCIALFGGLNSGVFLNPSPAQIKPTQTAETRDMMGCRSNGRSLILAEEWASDGEGEISDLDPAINAKAIAVTLCDTAGNDEDFGAWLIQEHRKDATKGSECKSLRKYLASVGGAKHAIIHEYEGPAAPQFKKEYATFPLGPTQTGKRLWPV